MRSITNPALARAHEYATQLGSERGWSKKTLYPLWAGLAKILADHTDGQQVLYSEVQTLKRPASHTRIAEVLGDLGLLHDDRPCTFTAWLERRTAEAPAGFREDVRDWLVWLHDGDTRTRPRSTKTAQTYFGQVIPLLHEWGQSRERLREVTHHDVVAALEIHRWNRATLSAVKSLFRFAHAYRRVFTNPATRIPTGSGSITAKNLLPLDQATIDNITTAADTPALRLVIALAAIHGARPRSIRYLTLDDIDIPNRRITIAGIERPLDDLTRQILEHHLADRRQRWPHATNRHVLLSQQNAWNTLPVSSAYLFLSPRQWHGVSLDAIRADRVLDEALHHGPDALRLTLLFGLTPATAIQYMLAARKILGTDLPDQQ